MFRATCAALAVFTAAVRGSNDRSPHIIYILADDLGWNFPGYHNPDVITPTLDKLATDEGVRLESAYMYKYCGPSRGSLLTGRYPWRLPSVRCNFIPSSIPEGVPLEYNFLPKQLAKANYESYHAGKWHLGFHTTEYTPVGRGFNHSFGFLEGGEDHWTHKCGAGGTKCKTPGQPANSKTNWDLWSQDTDNFPGGPAYDFNGTKGDESTYSGYIFPAWAVDRIFAHDQSRPMFMYLALQDTHSPYEAPQRFIDMYSFNATEAPRKNTFFAMVSVIDEGVRNVTAALRSTGMWENTLLIWATDNGSPTWSGGSNHPLRGAKGSNWEGGVRVPAFVSGGFLPSAMRGSVLHGLVHVSDWYATLSAVAGLGDEADGAGPSTPDSFNVWPYLSGEVSESPRTEIVLDHHMFTNESANIGSDTVCGGQEWFELPGYDALGSIRVGRHKLIVGPEKTASWYGQFSPNITAPSDRDLYVACWTPCVFDVVADPGEHVDLAASDPDLLRELWAKFNESNAEYHPDVYGPPVDYDGFCAGVNANGGWVSPWLEKEPASQDALTV